MKYELETNIKRISFPCPEMGFRVNHGKCVKCSIVNNPNDCWEKNVRKEIQQDCDIENEQNAEAYAVCPRCGSEDIVSTAFNGYMCATCGCPFSLDNADLKELMKDDYLEIDEEELNALFTKAKNRKIGC